MEEVAGTQPLPQPEMVVHYRNNIDGGEYNVFGSVTLEIPHLTRSEMLGIFRIIRIEWFGWDAATQPRDPSLFRSTFEIELRARCEEKHSPISEIEAKELIAEF